MTSDKDRTATINRLAELMRDIPVAMLTTLGTDKKMHSRPMVNVNREFNGDLWFLTPPADPKVTEIRINSDVNVCFSAPSEHRYVSLAGTAESLKDQKRAELLWSESCSVWFPSGTTPDKLAVIRVDVQSGEYWDSKKSMMVALGSLVGRILSGDPSRGVEHETVKWPNK